MSKMNEFDNILDECLGRLIDGESVGACLSRYPEYAAAIEPLLRTAQQTLKAADIQPRPEFRDRARYQFQAAIREMPVKESRGFFSVLRPGLAAVVMLAVVLLAGGGVVAAAGNSLPDSPLYSVKLATESVRLALTPSALGKAELNAQFADERVDEIIKLAEKGEATLIVSTTDRLNRQLMAVANLSGTGEEAAEATNFSDMRAPTAIPTATTTPAPTVTPAPAPTPSPTEKTTTAVAPVPTIIVPPPNEGVLGAANDHEAAIKNGGSEQERLIDTLTRHYSENIQALQAELEKAPESLKPALLNAIEVAEQAYSKALASLFS